MKTIGELFEFTNKYIFGIGVPLLLMLTGLFFCVVLKFFHFLHPLRTAGALFSGERTSRRSSVRALTLALAGTLGVGNMVGVASAISLGGAGAVFWMWMSAIVAMIVKYAEIVLAVRHRRIGSDGKPYGSAMCYIRDGIRGAFGKLLACVFAFFCLINALSMGSMIQVGAAAEAASESLGVPRLAIGIVFAAAVLFTVCRGKGGIMSATEKIVPFMSVGFMLLSIAVICLRPHEAVCAVVRIFEEAFNVKSGAAGVVGFLFSQALRYGAMRGILSNEAGCGTSPAAHATADCDIPAKQGAWGIFEVFADTIVLCTMTAIVILISYNGQTGVGYMSMTLEAYTAVLGSGAGIFLAVSVMAFGLATVLCWGYYFCESAEYIVGVRSCKPFLIVMSAIYSLAVLAGSVIQNEIVWEIADFALGSMTLINLFVLIYMRREVIEETRKYFGKKE